MDDLAVDFHYVIGRSSISGPELVHARFFDLNESASDLSTSTWVGRRSNTAKCLQFQSINRINGVVVNFRIVVSLVHGNQRVNELVPPATTASIHLASPDHIRLSGKNEDLNGLLRSLRFLSMEQSKNKYQEQYSFHELS